MHSSKTQPHKSPSGSTEPITASISPSTAQKIQKGSIINSTKDEKDQRKRPTDLHFFLPSLGAMCSERKGQRMGENRAYCDDADDDDEVFNGGFMKLLGCEDVVFEKRVQVEEEFLFSPPCSLSSSRTTSSSSSSSAGCYPQMLHFGWGHEEFLVFNSDNNYSAAAAPSPTGRSRARPCKKVETNGGGGLVKLAGNRKPKAAGFAGTIKVRKEKLGERISVLQQLVSPFGKTDTATVLHEAIGYIRFLHDQVQVLSSPYMQQFPLSSHQTEEGGGLRSRGLCLVPVSCTEDVVANNSSISTGADLWSPAALGGGSSSSSSGSKH